MKNIIPFKLFESSSESEVKQYLMDILQELSDNGFIYKLDSFCGQFTLQLFSASKNKYFEYSIIKDYLDSIKDYMNSIGYVNVLNLGVCFSASSWNNQCLVYLDLLPTFSTISISEVRST